MAGPDRVSVGSPTLGGPTHGTRQIRVDESVQHRIGRKPDQAHDSFTLAILVHARGGKRRVARRPRSKTDAASQSDPGKPPHHRLNERCRV